MPAPAGSQQAALQAPVSATPAVKQENEGNTPSSLLPDFEAEVDFEAVQEVDVQMPDAGSDVHSDAAASTQHSFTLVTAAANADDQQTSGGESTWQHIDHDDSVQPAPAPIPVVPAVAECASTSTAGRQAS